MSIADGQLVLQAATSGPHSAPVSHEQPQPTAPQQNMGSSEEAHTPVWQSLTGSNVNVSGSVSRIGCRAYPPAMATLAPSIRFDLAQAVDAHRFGIDRTESGLNHQQLQRAALLQAGLAQPVRQPVPLEEQVISLYPVWIYLYISILQNHSMYCGSVCMLKKTSNPA